MSDTQIRSTRWYDSILSIFFRVASSGTLPASWFREKLPAPEQRNKVEGPMHLEIVCHCWNYSNLLAYQLSSLINFAPSKLTVTMTVFYCKEDTNTQRMLDFFSDQDAPQINWNWQPLPKEQLFRRSIGRNKAAKATKADWIWFTDCDIIFRESCLDTLAAQLQGRSDSLVYPREENTTPMLDEDNPILQKGYEPQIVDIDDNKFERHTRDKAKGAFQIVHGDVARAVGYCNNISLYQTPASRWRKTYEDKVFRWLLGTRGVPVDMPNVFQIRHVVKGRYKKDSLWSKVRSKIRHLRE